MKSVIYERWRAIVPTSAWIAQEVQAVAPGAVSRGADGTLRVLYGKLGIKFQTYDQWIATGGHVPGTVKVAY